MILNKFVEGVEVIMKKIHETDDGYRLDRLVDNEEFEFDKLTGMISDEARYWFYRHTCTLKDLMELEFKMKPSV